MLRTSRIALRAFSIITCFAGLGCGGLAPTAADEAGLAPVAAGLEAARHLPEHRARVRSAGAPHAPEEPGGAEHLRASVALTLPHLGATPPSIEDVVVAKAEAQGWAPRLQWEAEWETNAAEHRAYLGEGAVLEWKPARSGVRCDARYQKVTLRVTAYDGAERAATAEATFVVYCPPAP